MILSEIETLIGPRLFVRFMAAFAGTDVRFPKRRSASSYGALLRVIGPEAARALRDRYFGETVYVPRNTAEERARRDEEIVARVARGESAADVARSYRVVSTLSERHVRRIVERMTVKASQT